GCRRNPDGSVTTPRGFRDAYKKLVEGGWIGVSAPAEFGGQDLPVVINQAVNEFFTSANMAFGMYAALTQGATAAIAVHGSPEQKKLYLPKLVSGQWAGTMNLTEPQCGTDLGLVRTRAAAQSDGSYKITGTKIFISAGEHDLAENIVHLVLARIDRAPAGPRGLSLFIVAKFPEKPADPIVVHPDVRRMLMSMRAFNEAARALVVWTALKSDIARRSAEAKEKQAAEDHLGLLTPVIKGILTDQGFANAVLA